MIKGTQISKYSLVLTITLLLGSAVRPRNSLSFTHKWQMFRKKICYSYAEVWHYASVLHLSFANDNKQHGGFLTLQWKNHSPLRPEIVHFLFNLFAYKWYINMIIEILPTNTIHTAAALVTDITGIQKKVYVHLFVGTLLDVQHTDICPIIIVKNIPFTISFLFFYHMPQIDQCVWQYKQYWHAYIVLMSK